MTSLKGKLPSSMSGRSHSYDSPIIKFYSSKSVVKCGRMRNRFIVIMSVLRVDLTELFWSNDCKVRLYEAVCKSYMSI